MDELTKNKTITLEDLIIKLKTKFKNLSISKMHLHRIIKDNNITLKLTRLRHEPIKRFGKKIDIDRKSTRLNSSHSQQSRMPSSA